MVGKFIEYCTKNILFIDKQSNNTCQMQRKGNYERNSEKISSIY